MAQKKRLIDEVIFVVGDIFSSNKKEDKVFKAALSTVAGGLTGGGLVAASGLTAVGAVGGGAGIGAAAGPVGILAGAVLGLTAYGAKKLLD